MSLEGQSEGQKTSCTLLQTCFSCTLLLAATATLSTTTAWGAWLAADVDRILDGQVWRLLTGPLVHSNTGHLVRDLAACVVLGFLYEPVFRRYWPWIVVSGLAVPTIVALAVHSELAFYCGLSGTAHALMAAAVVKELRTASGRSRRVFVAVTGLFVFKLVYEAVAGSLLVPLDLGPSIRPVPVAHLAGAVTGAVTGVLFTDKLLDAGTGERPAQTLNPCDSP